MKAKIGRKIYNATITYYDTYAMLHISTNLLRPLNQDLLKKIRFYDAEKNVYSLFNNIIYESEIIDEITIRYHIKSYVVFKGNLDINKLIFNKVYIYSKQFNDYFINTKANFNRANNITSISISPRTLYLFENNEFKVSHINRFETSANTSNSFINNYSIVSLNLYENYSYDYILKYVDNIIKIFGFVTRNVVNINKLIFFNENDKFELICSDYYTRYKLKLNDSVNEANSLNALKNIITAYYSVDSLASCINLYYEYIRNDLNDDFKLINLVNTIEMIADFDSNKREISTYAFQTNTRLIESNNKFINIKKVLMDNLKKDEYKPIISFIKQYYDPKYFELGDKLRYYFYNYFNLKESENSNLLITKIIKLRNYYVHGTEFANKYKLSDNELFLTQNLLKIMSYILIWEETAFESNQHKQELESTMYSIYKLLTK